MRKVGLVAKWVFIFGILIVWTYFIVNSITAGFAADPEIFVYDVNANQLDGKMVEVKEYNLPIYNDNVAGVERASSSEVFNVLFNYKFGIEQRVEEVPDESCSLRAGDGDIIVNEENFGKGTRLSYSITLKNNDLGAGQFVSSDKDSRLSLSLKAKKVIKTNANELVTSATGEGSLDKKKVKFSTITISFNKLTNKTSLNGNGKVLVDETMNVWENVSFNANNMPTKIIEGCSVEIKDLYLIAKGDKLAEKRNIQEVREILDEHPELVDMYGKLDRLYKDYWWTIVPDMMVS